MNARRGAVVGLALVTAMGGGLRPSWAQQPPDLTVTRIEVVQPGPPMRIGGCNQIVATIRNLSNRVVPARVSVQLSVEAAGSTNSILQQLPTMAGNGTAEVTFVGVEVPDIAQARLRVRVDPGGNVPEAIETNNERVQTYPVLGACP